MRDGKTKKAYFKDVHILSQDKQTITSYYNSRGRGEGNKEVLNRGRTKHTNTSI